MREHSSAVFSLCIFVFFFFYILFTVALNVDTDPDAALTEEASAHEEL